MKEKYQKECEKLKEQYMKETEIVLQKTDELYNEMVRKLGHKNFLSQSINKPIVECSEKYRKKFKELKLKYNIN